MSPTEARLRHKMLLELSKDDIRNKVRSQNVRTYSCEQPSTSLLLAAQVKLGAQAPAKLRSLSIDTHDKLPAAGVSKARLAPYVPKSLTTYRPQVCSAYCAYFAYYS